MEGGKTAFKMLTDKGARKPWSTWKDNIRMYLKEIAINTRNWVDSAQDRDYWRTFVNAALNLWILQTMELVNSFPYI